MNKIKDIIQIDESGINNFRAIIIVNVHKETVQRIIKLAQNKSINFQLSKTFNDDGINKLFYPDNTNKKYKKPEPDVDYILNELSKNKTLTIKMLHEKYLAQNPDSLGYTQFREIIKRSIGERNIRMHIDRKQGEKMYIDWAGDTGKMYDSKAGDQKSIFFCCHYWC